MELNREQVNENEEVWKQIKGSERLFEIYTYYPTFHDAKIRNVEINLNERKFSLTVDYCDFIKSPGDEISTKITIGWLNVQIARFNWHAEYLYGIKFQKTDGFIKTKFTDYPFGFDGEIISGEIEITKVEIETEDEGISGENTIRLLIS